jgi:hypothetical protein
MRRFVSLFILLPIAVIVVMLSVANRAIVAFSLDPIGGAASGWAIRAPLFVFLFIALLAGVLIGGAAVWFRQGRWRHAARLERANAERLRRETTQLRDQMAALRPSLPLGAGDRDQAA